MIGVGQRLGICVFVCVCVICLSGTVLGYMCVCVCMRDMFERERFQNQWSFSNTFQ